MNLVTGERLVFLRAGAETGGSYSENETHLQPGTAVPKAHLHLRQDEHFEVLSFLVVPTARLLGYRSWYRDYSLKWKIAASSTTPAS